MSRSTQFYLLSAWLIVTQYICTYYSSLSGQSDIFLVSGTLKNQVQNMELKKQGAKNRIIDIQKKGEAAFLTKNDPGFCTLVFSGPYDRPHFLRFTNRPMFSQQEYWVQIDWASILLQ